MLRIAFTTAVLLFAVTAAHAQDAKPVGAATGAASGMTKASDGGVNRAPGQGQDKNGSWSWEARKSQYHWEDKSERERGERGEYRRGSGGGASTSYQPDGEHGGLPPRRERGGTAGHINTQPYQPDYVRLGHRDPNDGGHYRRYQ
jgi:hypothetical protein